MIYKMYNDSGTESIGLKNTKPNISVACYSKNLKTLKTIY